MTLNKSNKKSLLNECCDEIVEEAWGGGGSLYGGAGGGAGSFSYTQTAGAKTWSPGSPPYRGMTGSPGGINTKDLGEESESFAKTAGKNFPFPIDQIFDNLVDAFIALENAHNQLQTCIKYNKVLVKEKEKKALLDHSLKQIEAIKELIRNTSAGIERATLST